MNKNNWINLHYALKLQNIINVTTLKTIIKTIIIYIVYVVTTCLIVASLSGCSTTHNKHYKAHNKVWDSYKTCSAYGNP